MGTRPDSAVGSLPIRRPAHLSLLTRVFLANASVLAIVALLLLFSPIEISFPVTNTQAVIIVTGFLVSAAINLVLLRGIVAPLRRLTATMRSVEPLEPGRRLVVAHADAEVEALTTAFNDMLDRLERERRESGRRALAAQEDERRRVARELHDEVGQVLTGVMLELEQAQLPAPPGTPCAQRSTRCAGSLASCGRRSLDDLGPPERAALALHDGRRSRRDCGWSGNSSSATPSSRPRSSSWSTGSRRRA